jgi:sirohydrochlorin ferrochelatase
LNLLASFREYSYHDESSRDANCPRFPFAGTRKMSGTALLLIAHGSRNQEANDDLHHIAGELRARGHGIVEASFLELSPPSIAEAGETCVRQGAEQVVLVPYFLSPGVHVRRDLTEARDQLSERFPTVRFVLAEPLGRHPLMLEVVAERVREALLLTSIPRAP